MDESAEHHEQTKKSRISLQIPEPKFDLISNLPDTLLCHILSFLPTKYAVGTSILSSRWKNLFPLIPKLKLEFDDSLLLHHPNRVAELKPKEELEASFLDFVERVLNRLLENGASIRRFRLICCRNYEADSIISCVGAAARLGVQTVQLDALIRQSNSCSKLIGCLNGCTTLVRLHLGRELHLFVADLPVVKFPNLKTLILGGISTFDGVESLFDGCPVLENLLLNCSIKNVSTFRICISSLKSLVLHCQIRRDTVMVIDTPKLEYLYHYGHPGVSYSFISKFDRILGLSLVLPVRANDPNYDERTIAYLINACSQVEVLNLRASTMEVLCSWSLPLPNFLKLKRLQISVMSLSGWSMLGRLLRSASNLETLIIDEGSNMLDECFACFWLSSNDVPDCLSSTLKKITIRAFKGREDEIKFIKYILENGKVLEQLVFECDFNFEENYAVWKITFESEVKSETCEIIFGKKGASDYSSSVKRLICNRLCKNYKEQC